MCEKFYIKKKINNSIEVNLHQKVLKQFEQNFIL